jgi:ABC-type molybdenum transport system ATPase subunit/photorepair protein PhrA
VIGSGFENIFTYRKLTEEQKKSIVKIIDQFDVERKYLNEEELHNTLFAEAEPSLQALSLVLRAAVKKPDLLVLDEPFAGMSPDLVQQCRQFLDHGLEDHQTLIFISHYEEEWPSTIGKRMHLEDGRGSATEL